MHPLEQLRDDALREIQAARDQKSLESVRVKYLGKTGSISEWGERMKTLGKEERPLLGKLLNQTRNTVTAALEQQGQKVRAEKGEGLPRPPLKTFSLRQRRGHEGPVLGLSRPQNAKTHVSLSLDPTSQRRRTSERHDLQPPC